MLQGSSVYNFGVKQTRGLPLIDCPDCGRDQLRLLQSSTADNLGKFFVKCPRNEKGKKMTKECTFFMWLEQYKQFLGDLGMLIAGAATSDSNEVWRSIEHMKVKVAGMNGCINKLRKTMDFLLLVNCFSVLTIILVMLVVLVK